VPRKPIELEIAIAQLLNKDRDWGNIIRGCVGWSEDQKAKGITTPFPRHNVYHWLGRGFEGPKLTPLVTAGVLRRATASNRYVYYELNHEPQVILSALSRAWAKTGD
jgi:hypothetical protein